MNKRTTTCCVLLLFSALFSSELFAQTNPLWTQQKVKNYLPHMTSPDFGLVNKGGCPGSNRKQVNTCQPFECYGSRQGLINGVANGQ